MIFYQISTETDRLIPPLVFRCAKTRGGINHFSKLEKQWFTHFFDPKMIYKPHFWTFQDICDFLKYIKIIFENLFLKFWTILHGIWVMVIITGIVTVPVRLHTNMGKTMPMARRRRKKYRFMLQNGLSKLFPEVFLEQTKPKSERN